MQTIKKLYRDTYTGEDVVTNLVYKNSTWEVSKEWIPNAVTNIYTTTQALVIGGGPSWKEVYGGFDLAHIANHKGGLLGADRLQTYGANSLYKTFTPDFLIIDDEHAEELATSGYCESHIVYAHANPILDYPSKFYLVPQDPSWNAGAVAMYLACFDGHKKVFFMGFDGRQGDDVFYEKTLSIVFDLYPEVDFVRVMPTDTYYMPESWKYKVNLRQITFNDFVIEADLG